MLTSQELVAALYGAYRLARRDPRGLGFFEDSVPAFWRSFAAAVIIAPLYALFLIVAFTSEGTAIGGVRYGVVQAISYVIGWTAFPLAAFYVCQLLDCEHRFVRYIVAYNWSAVLWNPPQILIALLAVSGAVSAGTGQFLSLMALLLILIYTWFIARTALDVGGIAAVGVVMVDLVLSVLVQALSDGFL